MTVGTTVLFGLSLSLSLSHASAEAGARTKPAAPAAGTMLRNLVTQPVVGPRTATAHFWGPRMDG